MKTIQETLQKNINGLFYGNRVLLPFSGTILKIIFDNEILMDFSPDSELVHINATDEYMEIYFLGYDNLKDSISKYECIKLIIVEKGDDIFDLKNHMKISLHPEEKHKLKIDKTEDDILFIE
jgi:hypothetical protein